MLEYIDFWLRGTIMSTYKTGEITKQTIYKAARTQFFEKGYNKTTLASISKASNSNTAMISYHFKNKESLALEIYDEFMAAVKVLTMHLLKKITPNNDLMFITATEIRIHNRIIQTSPEFARFLLELNNTNFYLKEESATVGFFFNINKKYHLNLDKDQLKAVAVTNYAISASLQAARANGMIDCTNDFMTRTVYMHFAKLMSFDDAFIQATLEDSLNAFEKLNIWIGPDFQLDYDKI